MQTIVIHAGDTPNLTEKALARAIAQLVMQNLAPVDDVFVLPGVIPANTCPPPLATFGASESCAPGKIIPGALEAFYQSEPHQTVINLHLAPGLEADVASAGNCTSVTVRSK